MKLLAKSDVSRKLQAENDDLVVTNIRLRQYWQIATDKLNDLKEDYEPDKMAKLKDFEEFCKKLLIRKAKLLEEFSGLEQAITEKKELYYGFIEKQDKLDEKIYQMNEQEKKLKLREEFVVDLEQKWRAKNII